ncbi:YdeI/OmpD-associated family protein [Dermatobacter hominis]|uniref:YdeI/OmpD-associated family protein n=1 Tax=Dermatobacter hominis TaxID=2884263 RepID=UPI001D10A567|nr:YdeI/OmpD-associated family protein [Dermatobacter hominis]UDY34465.1 YdeI/OmpD-associated family protein [Dermatobacter hominis]
MAGPEGLANPPSEHAGRPVVAAATPAEWTAWLEEHADDSPAVWLTVWKQAAGPDALDYESAVLEAVCFGWIDSTVHALDDLRFLMLVAPRKPGSGWSASNKARIEQLEAAGRMRPQGRTVIEAAKADGSWTLLDSVEALEAPDDLLDALAAAGVRERWDEQRPGRRKLVLLALVQAKRPATRQKRIDAAVDALVAHGELPS